MFSKRYYFCTQITLTYQLFLKYNSISAHDSAGNPRVGVFVSKFIDLSPVLTVVMFGMTTNSRFRCEERGGHRLRVVQIIRDFDQDIIIYRVSRRGCPSTPTIYHVSCSYHARWRRRRRRRRRWWWWRRWQQRPAGHDGWWRTDGKTPVTVCRRPRLGLTCARNSATTPPRHRKRAAVVTGHRCHRRTIIMDARRRLSLPPPPSPPPPLPLPLPPPSMLPPDTTRTWSTGAELSRPIARKYHISNDAVFLSLSHTHTRILSHILTDYRPCHARTHNHIHTHSYKYTRTNIHKHPDTRTPNTHVVYFIH